MASPIPSRHVVLAFSLLLLLLPNHSLAKSRPRRKRTSNAITYHGGEIMRGDINVVLIWYGQFEQSQKDTIKSFLNSINGRRGHPGRRSVGDWWKVVQSYQTFAKPKTPWTRSRVRIVGETSDYYGIGKIFTMDFISMLVNRVVGGMPPNTVALVFTAHDVAVHELCLDKCQLHGVLESRVPYVLVSNAINECPEACVWPFYYSKYMARTKPLTPPNGDAVADSMVVHLAGGLAELVTNPYKTGFYGGTQYKAIEITGGRCKNLFGRRAAPRLGNIGRLRYEHGRAFNARGKKGSKFLLPAIWNPKTRKCFAL